MLIVRCLKCGVDMCKSHDLDPKGYREALSDYPCQDCQSKPVTTEEKLLRTIFNEGPEGITPF